MQACFVNSETPPIETKHICWYAKKELDSGATFYALYEVVEEKYFHPDAPDDAFVQLTNIYLRKRVLESQAAEILVLNAIQDTCDKLHL